MVHFTACRKIKGTQLSNSTVLFHNSFSQCFFDLKKGKHAIGRLVRNLILEKIKAITTILEKSFTSRKSFGDLKFEIGNLLECCIKYTDYLEQTLKSVKES